MKWKRITLAVAVLLAAVVSVSALQAAQSRSSQVEAPAFVQWSVNGQLVGEREPAPLRARDFHASWTTGGAVFVWTKNGQLNSDAIESPSGANGFRVAWGKLATKFTSAAWQRNGTDVAVIPLAKGSNGVYVRLNGGGVFDSAFWSRRQQVLQPVTPAPGANDVRVELKSSVR